MDYIDLMGVQFLDNSESLEAIRNFVEDDGIIVSVDYANNDDPILKIGELELHVGDFLVRTAEFYAKVEKDSIEAE